jgi:2-hydroxycyclohexanecarboxyl-CoA dehydrogenase
MTSRVALVTGGTGGIGTAIVKRLADMGHKVATNYRNEEKARAWQEQMKAAGYDIAIVKGDVTSPQEAEAMVREVEATLGPVDILVNNAGWDVFRPFLQTTPADWQRLIAINLVGALNMHHVVLPEMVERRSGRVVNVASDAGRVGSSGESVYSACKGAMISLSKTLARENASKGISINVVCPGPTETKLLTDVVATANNPEKLLEAFRRAVPMGRLGLADDLPGAICFFASDDAAFITGQVLSVSGGLTMSG